MFDYIAGAVKEMEPRAVKARSGIGAWPTRRRPKRHPTGAD